VIHLWDIQERLIKRTRTEFLRGRSSVLLVSPTGSGKTVVFSYLAGRMRSNNLRVMILAHRKELLAQISKALNTWAVPHGVIAPRQRYTNDPMVHVGSVFSVARRLDELDPPDWLIIDEAHHAIVGSTWGNCVTHWRAANRRFRMLGVTATPERLSGEGLSNTFESMVVGPGTRELIDFGYLSEYDIYAPALPLDTSQVHMQGGDYKRTEAEALVNRPTITGNAVNHYRRLLNGKPSIAFCVSIKHAQQVAEDFRASGFRAVSVDGKMRQSERDAAIEDFRRGQVNVLASCDLISEGFDVPDAYGAILLRPTESTALYLQQVGRVLRKVEGKEKAIILDHVGNSARHGLPCQNREWTLAGNKRTRKRDPQDIQIRQCPECGGVSALHAMVCRECGYEFQTKARTIKEIEGELQLIKEKERLEFKRQRSQADDLEALIELGRMRGMKNPYGWARHVMAAREKKRIRRLA
jgi:DNA repair protein RadD